MAKRTTRAKATQRHPKSAATSSTDTLFQSAVEAHQQGQLERAEQFYRQILLAHPRHADALLLLGHLCLNSDRIVEAIEVTRRAIAENPAHAGAHFNLGLAMIRAGNDKEALASLDRALEAMPAYAEAWCNRGIALQNLDRHAEALDSLDRAIALDSGSHIAHNNRGISLQKLGRHDEAISAFRRALSLTPDDGVTQNNLGISLLALQQYEDALGCFERAASMVPDYAEAYVNLGLAMQRRERDLDAVAAFDRALAIHPDNGGVLASRAMSHLNLGHGREAAEDLDRAVRAVSAAREAGSGHAAVHAAALNNCGNVLRNLGRNDDALRCYEEAAACIPEDSTTRMNLALCRLALGDFERGWPDFEYRRKTDQYREAESTFSQPPWLGVESLHGRTILLHAEQGLGDTIQFCRYATQVAAAGAKVLLEVQPPLEPLLGGLEGVSQVLAQGEPRPAFDFHCPLMSLPLALGTRAQNIPAAIPYLRGDEARRARWREILGSGSGPRIGLAWSGSAGFANDRHRSMAFAMLDKLLSHRATFVSLQKEIRPGDRATLEQHPEVLDFSETLRDFADTAALIEEMDLVISVDTSVAHLAGALGKPVWILLPVNSDWRWLLGRDDSAWYPTARLFRQPRLGDWGSVMDQVGDALSIRH